MLLAGSASSEVGMWYTACAASSHKLVRQAKEEQVQLQM